MQRIDLFGAAAAFETVRMPDGTEAAIPTEHAAALYVNEQPAFRVVCTPQLLPQLALGRLLTIPGEDNAEAHSSGSLSAMIGCNCLVELPAGSGPVTPGEEVEVLSFVQ